MIIPSILEPARGAAWPLSSVLPPMGALMTAPGTARAHVRAVLAGWRLAGLADAAELVASELVTNAVTASTGDFGERAYVDGVLAVIWLRLLSDRTRVLIEVWDQAAGVPVVRAAGPDAEAGRGLHLIISLTRGRWGWHTARGAGAKCVWAEISGDHPSIPV